MKKVIAFLIIINYGFILNQSNNEPVKQEHSMAYIMNELDSYFYQAAMYFINFDDKKASHEIKSALQLINKEELDKQEKLVIKAMENNIFSISTYLNSPVEYKAGTYFLRADLISRMIFEESLGNNEFESLLRKNDAVLASEFSCFAVTVKYKGEVVYISPSSPVISLNCMDKKETMKIPVSGYFSSKNYELAEVTLSL